MERSRGEVKCKCKIISYHAHQTIEDDEYIHKQYKARRLDTPGVHYINYLLA